MEDGRGGEIIIGRKAPDGEGAITIGKKDAGRQQAALGPMDYHPARPAGDYRIFRGRVPEMTAGKTGERRGVVLGDGREEKREAVVFGDGREQSGEAAEMAGGAGAKKKSAVAEDEYTYRFIVWRGTGPLQRNARGLLSENQIREHFSFVNGKVVEIDSENRLHVQLDNGERRIFTTGNQSITEQFEHVWSVLSR